MHLVTNKQKDFLDNSPLASTGGALPTLGTIVTANKSVTQAASTAVDVAGIVTDFNALLAKLKTAGIVL